MRKTDIRYRRYYWIIILIVIAIPSTVYFFGDTMMIPYTTDSGYVQKMTSIRIDNDVDIFDDNTIHEITIDMDWEDYESLIETYEQTEEKEYFKTDINIDGITIEDVGIRLKGNMGLQTAFKGSSQIDTMQLPFLVKFDKYVEGQNYQGISEMCIRIGSSDALLEEPLALYAHSISGAVVPEWSYASVKVSELDPAYYVICENINDYYLIKYFDDYDGVLYKAGNFVSFTYKGDLQIDYMDDFDQKTQVNEADYTYLIEFLEFVSESSNEQFEEQLSDWVDVDALITMMAVNDLVENSDSFSGLNSNYYLYYDQDSEKFLILTWDMNLAFGAMMGQGDMQKGGAFNNMEDRENFAAAAPNGIQQIDMENMTNFTSPEGMNMSGPMMDRGNMTEFTPPDGGQFSAGMEKMMQENTGEMDDFAAPAEGFGNRPDRMGGMEDMPDMADGNLPEGVERGEMNSRNNAENTLKDRFFANENFSTLYEERYEEIANGIYCNNLLLEKLDLIAETFTEYNSEHNLLDQESYDSEVEDMRSYIEEKQAENC